MRRLFFARTAYSSHFASSVEKKLLYKSGKIPDSIVIFIKIRVIFTQFFISVCTHPSAN